MKSLTSNFRRLFLPTLLSLAPALILAGPAPAPWAVAMMPTPVLSCSDFRSIYGGPFGDRLFLSSAGLVRELEMVAFPGTVFSVLAEIRAPGKPVVYQVTTDEYPYPTKTGYFVDGRCVRLSMARPPARPRPLPSRNKIRFRLLSSIGRLYVWGGNYQQGIPEMLSWYPSSTGLDDSTRKMWMARGVDCSGLIYEATGGYTPRNARALTRFGRPISIAGLTPEAIAACVEPLDLIVWKKHVVIVLDKEHVIQSKTDDFFPGAIGGVRTDPLIPYLRRLMKERTPVDDCDRLPLGCTEPFVVRRWYPEEAGRGPRKGMPASASEAFRP